MSLEGIDMYPRIFFCTPVRYQRLILRAIPKQSVTNFHHKKTKFIYIFLFRGFTGPIEKVYGCGQLARDFLFVSEIPVKKSDDKEACLE